MPEILDEQLYEICILGFCCTAIKCSQLLVHADAPSYWTFCHMNVNNNWMYLNFEPEVNPSDPTRTLNSSTSAWKVYLGWGCQLRPLALQPYRGPYWQHRTKALSHTNQHQSFILNPTGELACKCLLNHKSVLSLFRQHHLDDVTWRSSCQEIQWESDSHISVAFRQMLLIVC
jgi:hypothetical protein